LFHNSFEFRSAVFRAVAGENALARVAPDANALLLGHLSENRYHFIRIAGQQDFLIGGKEVIEALP
jgi:hypothetical protein